MSSEKIEITDVLAFLISYLKIDIDKIDDDICVRKYIQKFIYVLKQPRYGLDLGHRYSLYLAGPYSTDLSNDYYFIADNLDIFKKTISTHKLSRSITKRLRDFISLFDDDYILLECVATLHFLYNVTFAYIGNKKLRKTKCKMYLRKIKPQYRSRESKVRKAFSIVQTLTQPL